MASAFTISYPTAAGLLLDSKSTAFDVQYDNASAIAPPGALFRAHLSARSVPGVANAISVAYRWHLLLVGCVVKLDVADAGLRTMVASSAHGSRRR